MAIVFAMLIVGWLLAFALGTQSGFDNQLAAKPAQSSDSEAPATYRGPASVA